MSDIYTGNWYKTFTEFNTLIREDKYRFLDHLKYLLELKELGTLTYKKDG